MNFQAETIRDWAIVGWHCDICGAWHIDSDDDPVGDCYYCGRSLCPATDYSCRSCTREACDNCCQACQEDDCDVITCIRCVDRHLAKGHPLEAAAL